MIRPQKLTESRPVQNKTDFRFGFGATLWSWFSPERLGSTGCCCVQVSRSDPLAASLPFPRHYPASGLWKNNDPWTGIASSLPKSAPSRSRPHHHHAILRTLSPLPLVLTSAVPNPRLSFSRPSPCLRQLYNYRRATPFWTARAFGCTPDSLVGRRLLPADRGADDPQAGAASPFDAGVPLQDPHLPRGLPILVSRSEMLFPAEPAAI